MYVRILVAGLLLALGLAAAADAQTSRRPKAPNTLCIGSKCSQQPPQAADGGGPIKWNPGHYMASDAMLYPNNTLSRFSAEFDHLNGWDAILGYRVTVTWGALEPTKGNYDFTLLDAMLQRLKTHYDKPKRLVIAIVPGRFTSTMGGNDGSAVPMYIQQGSAYGPSPVAGRYGWWGKSSGGKSTGPYAAALYRPAVMDRMIALLQALGAHYDSEPYFEAVMMQEDAWMFSLWNGAPDYAPTKPDSAIAQFKRMLSAATAAFPHTSVIMQNTWAGTLQPTMELESWMVANRIAPGTSDVVGQSAFDDHGYEKGLSWGLQSYLGRGAGALAEGSMRPKARAMVDVEAPDMVGNYFTKYGGPFAPADIVKALNQTYGASHAFWTYLVGTESFFGGKVPAAAKWSNLAETISATPLTNTGYPPNYPQ